MLSEIALGLLRKARAGGAEQAEVRVSSSLAREVSVRLGEVDTLEEARDRGVTVTVYRNKASGTATTGDLSPEALERAVEQALAIATYTQPDPAGGLADAERMAERIEDFDCWHPATPDMNALLERARAIETAGREVDPRIDNSEGAGVSTSAAIGVYANSHGFLAADRHTGYGQSCVLVARDERGMQRDWDWDDQGRFDALAAPELTGRGAAERALKRLGARRAPTGPTPVLFTPDTALGLIRHLVGAASGGNLYRRSSFLLDRRGEAIFPDFVQIHEDPHRPGEARSSSFDAEGVATKPAPLIEAGRLVRYLLGSYSARKLGLETTGNAGGVRNLLVRPGKASQAELIRQMGRGLVVTEVMGQGVNLVTGDYSRGASGYWIEDGQVAYPVEEITIAGNLRDLYAGVVALGNDVETRRNVQTPSILIERMTVAGE
ncbi:metalloprotease PmbA [Wenzhouxiangella sp. XN79A]|nr:metalloprotease PmbA [Wenzhouxiangella sp. XN79A]